MTFLISGCLAEYTMEYRMAILYEDKAAFLLTE